MSEIRVDTISEKTSANGVAIDGLTIKDGGITATTGTIVFNEASADVDFRVESNGNANMLFVDGGNNRIGVGTASPQTTLHVEGTAPIIRLSDSNSTSEDDAVSKIQFYDRNNSDLNAEIISGDGSESNLIISAHNNRSVIFQTSGNTERMRIDSTGAVTKPAQPAFLAIIASTQSNIANGNTIAFGTEVYDQNADFASSTFTAPVTGKYQFNFLISVTQLDYDATFHRIQLVTSNRTFNFDIKSSQNYTANPNYATFGGSMCVDMDTSDTAKLVWSQSAGENVSDVFDSTYFSGNLVC